MIIQLAIILAFFGLVIGSFLNVCIDRLPPKRRLYMGEKGDRFNIEISNLIFDDDPVELFKGKNVCVTGKIVKDVITGNPQVVVAEKSQITVKEADAENAAAIPWSEAKDKIGSIVTVYGQITDGGTVQRSFVSPSSHCDSCQHWLGILDNIPLFSYIFLRGRCRYCKARIPLRVLLVEVITGLLFFAAYWRFGMSVQFVITVFWGCVFIVIIFIDWEHQLILNKITYPAAVIALIILAVDSFVPGMNLFGSRTFIPQTSLYSGLISGVVLLVFFLLIALLRPGSMGMGDAKLVALIGFVSGFPLVVFSMLIGVVIGGVVAIVLLAARKKGRKDIIPYGTFLAIGPIVAMLLDDKIIDWYLALGR